MYECECECFIATREINYSHFVYLTFDFSMKTIDIYVCVCVYVCVHIKICA